jgi:hypothetical protein
MQAPDAGCEVRASATVVRASCSVRLLRKALAVRFCDQITAQALREGSAGLVMNLASLGKATPPAGLYAMKSLRSLPVRRIALVGGNGFMRTFARAVLTLGRYPDFGFFHDSETAEAWAGS